MNDKVAIIGLGQMASILAHRIPGSVRKVIIGRRKAEAMPLADEVGGVASEQMSAVRGCRVIFLALPGAAIPQVLTAIQPHLSQDALVVNTASDLVTSEVATDQGIRLVAAKVLGHPRELQLGSQGVVVLDLVELAEANLLEALLAPIGPVIQGNERQVTTAAAAIDEVLTRAEEELRRRLTELGLTADLVPVVIASTAPGVLRAMAGGEQEPDRREAMRKMGAGESAASRVSH